MAKLDDLLAKANSKSQTIAFKPPRKTLGLRETMRSIREQDVASTTEISETATPGTPLNVREEASNQTLETGELNVSEEILKSQNEFKTARPKSRITNAHKSTIRAQLEHKDDIGYSLENESSESSSESNDNSIRAQLEHKSEKTFSDVIIHKSTIGAQDLISKSNSVETELSLEHNKSTIDEPSKKYSVSIGAQLEHKIEGIGSESESTPLKENNPSLEHNKSTIGAQTAIARSNGAQLEHKTRPIRAQKQRSLEHTLEHNKSTIQRLSGHEKKLLYFIYDTCLARGGTTSGPLTKRVIVDGSQITESSFKTVVKRVVDKGFLKRLEAKRGNGGYLSFEIPFDVYQDIMLTENKNVIRAQLEHNKSTERSTNGSSKLVSYNNTNLLASTESRGESAAEFKVLPEFVHADISSLSRFGISKKHLLDLHNQKRTYELTSIEDFIWKFEKYASDPANIAGVRNLPALFVSMAHQLNSGVDPLQSIKTPEQNALEELIERNKRALYELKRQKEEARTLEFEIWFEKLNRQERDELSPPNSIVESGSELQKRALMGYFEKEVWNG